MPVAKTERITACKLKPGINIHSSAACKFPFLEPCLCDFVWKGEEKQQNTFRQDTFLVSGANIPSVVPLNEASWRDTYSQGFKTNQVFATFILK